MKDTKKDLKFFSIPEWKKNILESSIKMVRNL